MEDMGNISRWLEEFEEKMGQRIQAIVVGVHYRSKWGTLPQTDENVLLSRDAGLAKLDEDYDHGYGGADCYPMYAWTADWVLFMHEYDGATSLGCVPRNPTACAPDFDGAGAGETGDSRD